MTGKKSAPKNLAHELDALYSSFTAEIAKLETRVGELSSENARLHAELKQKRGVRAAAHGLYRALDDAIIARIDRRGFVRKPKKRLQRPIPQAVLSSKDMQTLMEAARQYDAGFFRYHTSSSGMRLRYRVLSKAYRIGRDTAVFGLKKGYRAVRRIVK